MRKSLWIILTVLLVAVGAPFARADDIVNVSVTKATFTGTPECNFHCTWDFSANFEYDNTTQAILLETMTFHSEFGDFSFLPDSFTWRDLTGSTISGGFPSTGAPFLPGVYSTELFLSTDDNSFGHQTAFTTVIVTRVPEPNTLSLSLLGIGLMLVMRKRIAQQNG